MPALDIKTAFESGLDAARKSDRAHKEIKEVFDDFAAQLETASNNRIKISLRDFPVKDWRKLAGLTFPPEPVTNYTGITAENPAAKSSKLLLAKWKPAPMGYPCLISWGDQERYCEDKEALLRCLKDFVADPLIGEKFLSLMQLEAKSEPDDKTSE